MVASSVAAPSDAALINGHEDRIEIDHVARRAAPSDAALINGHEIVAMGDDVIHHAAPSDAALINGHLPHARHLGHHRRPHRPTRP